MVKDKKTGRPPKPKGHKRKSRTVCFSAVEWDALAIIAEKGGLTRGEFLRNLAMPAIQSYYLETHNKAAH